MRHRPLGVDPVARRKEIWHDTLDGDVTIEHKQDVQAILETNHEDRNNQRAYRGEAGRTVGRIPAIIYEQLVREGRIQNGQDLLKYLNTEEARPWKLYPGRL